MAQEATLATLIRLLSEHFEIDTADLHPDSTFDELGLDSLAVTELLVVTEQETGARLSVADAPTGTSISLADIAWHIDQRRGNQAPAPTAGADG
ncbi:acyl carrier protein [Streptomyces sp. ET3-23]|uniref:acyl carrier protein n=1 Tax=Streptomyces sp. ET3-23 TaxID=2885643 RepID=UPI001D1111DB|nr:acyl carrier protein [Streptomyces sp. ET3-23]MCC2280897.1 acyl carrier protein [Streptomyces sp. ET3-23]